MPEIINLKPGEDFPEADDEERWLHVHASDDGRFFGSGWSRKPSGEDVFYVSLSESDISLEAAIAAATEWALKYDVPRIWVQATPD